MSNLMPCSNTALLNDWEIEQSRPTPYTDKEEALLDAQEEHDQRAAKEFFSESSGQIACVLAEDSGYGDDVEGYLMEIVWDKLLEQENNPLVKKLQDQFANIGRPE